MKTMSHGLALAALALSAGMSATAADAAMQNQSPLNAVKDIGHVDSDLGLTSVDNGMSCSGAGANYHQDLSVAVTSRETAGLALLLNTDHDARTVFPDGGA